MLRPLWNYREDTDRRACRLEKTNCSYSLMLQCAYLERSQNIQRNLIQMKFSGLCLNDCVYSIQLLIGILARNFVQIQKLILKLMWKCKYLRMLETNFKKKRWRAYAIPLDLKKWSNATVCYFAKNGAEVRRASERAGVSIIPHRKSSSAL